MLGFWVALNNPCFITSDYSTKKCWFSLKTLDDFLDTPICNVPSDLNLTVLAPFYADFPPAEIFGENLPNTFFFHIQQTCDHSNNQPTIPTHHTVLHVRRSLKPCLLKTSSSRNHFTTMCSSLNLLCHSKTRVFNMVLSPYSCWSFFKCLRWSLLASDKKFQVYLLFGFHHSFLRAHSWTTSRRGANYSIWKKCKDCGKLKL